MTRPTSSPLSIAYQALVKTAPVAEHPRLGRVWGRAFDWVARDRRKDVAVPFYGSVLRIPPSAVYPIYARRWQTYNDPLVQLAVMLHESAGVPVHVVDVGAAMGDTVALLRGLCPDAVATIDCVEGEASFANYLRSNTAGDPGTTVFESIVSDGSSGRALVPNRVGTATATGAEGTPACTLDEVLANAGRVVGLLKVDVDGYDGRALAGARGLLRDSRPHVLFEWAPTYYVASGSDWLQPFAVLAECGYDQFVFYDKYGAFSHFMSDYDEPTVRLHAELCLHSQTLLDWHYDVIALPAGSPLSMIRLAELSEARARKAASR